LPAIVVRRGLVAQHRPPAPTGASRLDERRDRDRQEDEGRRGGDEPVHRVGDDHGPSSLRKGHLTATVGNAMLLISMYVRRILTVSRESAAQTTSAR
jgi:hypothetical protein